jgi:hypothetical protein
MTTVNELIRKLKKNYKGTDHIAYDIWSTEDVISHAEDNELKITKKQANDVIDEMENNKDAEQGLTWDMMDYWFKETLHMKDMEQKIEVDEDE